MPEVVLQHPGERRSLIVECKLRGFGPDPDPNASDRSQRGHQSRQATSLLIITGDQVARHAGFEDPVTWNGSLLYVVGEGEESGMETTLSVLGTRIRGAGLPHQNASAAGLYQRADGLYFVPASGLPELGVDDGVQVMETEGEDAGDVLQLIPLLPYDTSVEKPTETQKQAAEERLRATVASIIGRQIGSHPFAFTLEDVLQEAIEMWAVWSKGESRSNFEKAARKYIMVAVSSLDKYAREVGHPVTVTYSRKDGWRWGAVSARAARTVRQALGSAVFRRGRLDLWELRQGDLFDPQ